MKLTIDIPPLGKRKPKALPPRIGTRSRNRHHVIAAWRKHTDEIVWAYATRARVFGWQEDIVVTLTRVRTSGPAMDSDSLHETMHGVRDGVADALWCKCPDHNGPCGHLHDGNADQWLYAQEVGPKAGVRVEIELRTQGEGG